MGIPIGEDVIRILNFPSDQVIYVQDEDNAHNMLRKLHKEYFKWGLQKNLNKC